MSQASASVAPATDTAPAWFIKKGHKMHLGPFDPKALELKIQNNAASIVVNRNNGPGDERWNLHWHVDHGYATAYGDIRFSDGELSRCFGLHDGLGRDGAAVALRSGSLLTAADLGMFVRLGNFLNIPGPAATGMAGDPCVSIYLTSTIKEAVRSLITASYPKST